MPFLAPNPNVGTGGAPVATPPMQGQYPGGNELLRQFELLRRAAPWLFPPNGRLDPGVDVQPDLGPQPHLGLPQRGLLEPVADIYNFTKKGLLGTLATEGAGGRGLGSRGGGLLGSKWRDPAYIQQYEVQQGLKPGSIKQPSAEVKQMPIDPQARLLGKLLAEKPVATVKLPPGPRADGYVHATDVLKWAKQNNIPADKALQMANDRASAGPTPAQMARPVKQTPEISAKLAEARAARAERSKVSPLLNKEDREAMRVEAADKAARRSVPKHGLATAPDLAKIGNDFGLSWEKMVKARDGTVAAGLKPTPENVKYWIAQMRAQGLFKPELP